MSATVVCDNAKNNNKNNAEHNAIRTKILNTLTVKSVLANKTFQDYFEDVDKYLKGSAAGMFVDAVKQYCMDTICADDDEFNYDSIANYYEDNVVDNFMDDFMDDFLYKLKDTREEYIASEFYLSGTHVYNILCEDYYL